jgi:hypothetical protein
VASALSTGPCRMLPVFHFSAPPKPTTESPPSNYGTPFPICGEQEETDEGVNVPFSCPHVQKNGGQGGGEEEKK